MLPQSTAEHYRAQQRLTVATITAVRGQWRRMGPEFDASWSRIRPAVLTLVTAAQLGAARSAADYIPAVLAETGQDADPEGQVVPRALAGVASDGRPLDTLLDGAVVHAKESQSLDVGGRWLDMAVATQVADAARVAAGVAIAARPQVSGYVRMLNPPSCSRCAVLAGKWFRWNAGFARHPCCDCRHIPSSENMAGDLRTDPEAYFASLDPAQRDRVFTKAGAQAISDGADIGQVVNARRGMQSASIGGRNVLVTSEGITRRGYASYVRRGTARIEGRAEAEASAKVGRRGYVDNYVERRLRRPRLMPEQIYAIADSRQEAIRLLARNGYLTDVPGMRNSSIADVARFAANA